MTDGTMSPADLAAVTGNNGFMNGDGAWWIIILFLFAFCGWGGGYGNGGGAAQNYVLASDFATLQRQLSDGFGGVEKGIDTIRNGLCDGFYTSAQLNNQTNMNIMQNGYETRDAINGVGNLVQANTTQGVMNTNAIQNQIQSCCCENEKQTMQNRFDMAQYNCQTLQAIDKLGDRIIGHMDATEKQNLRDENFALKLSASQNAQNIWLKNSLRPEPVPAYNVPTPWGCGWNNCGCN